MGTKVQCKNYFPGYYSMKDLNEDTNSSWPLYYYEDRVVNGQFYGGLAPAHVNGYSDYDKEVLKQTMLKHETTFRKQVYELHRLYRVQRDLMDELKKKEGCNHSVQLNTFQSSSFSCPLLTRDTETAWQMLHLPVVNSSCSRTGISDTETPSNFSKESSLHACLTSKENGGFLKGSEVDSKLEKSRRRMLDLQLPADAFIDCEDTEQREDKNLLEPFFGSMDPINWGCGPEPNDVKLTLGTAENPSCTKETWKTDSHVQNCLADLNQPHKELCYDEAIASATKFPSPMTYNGEPFGLKRPNILNSNCLSPETDYFQGRLKGEGTWSVFLHEDKALKRQEWLFSSNDHEKARSHTNLFTSSFPNRNLSASSALFVDRPKQPPEFSSIFPHKQNVTESWCKEKPTNHLGLSQKGSHLADPNHSAHTFRTTPGWLSGHPHSDYAYTASPPVSSWRNSTGSMNHIPAAVQALACFSRSAPLNTQIRSSNTSSQNPGNACEKWQYNGDSRSRLDFNTKILPCPDGFHCNFQAEDNTSSVAHMLSNNFYKPHLNKCDNPAYEKLEGQGSQNCLKGFHCLDVKSKDMNLNLTIPNGFHEGFTSLQNLTVNDMDGRKDHLSVGASWFSTKQCATESVDINKKATQLESGFRQGCDQLKTNCGVSARGSDEKKELGDGSFLSSLIIQANKTEIQGNEALDTLNGKRIIGFDIHDKTQRSNISSWTVSHQDFFATDAKDRVKDGRLKMDSTSHTRLLSSEKQIYLDAVMEKGVGDNIAFKDRINLNCSATSTEQTKSEISTKDELEVPSQLSTRSGAIRFTSAIDLEAPIISLEEEHTSPAELSLEINQMVSPFEPQSKAEGSQAMDSLPEMQVQVVAETIVAFSTDTCKCTEDNTCPPLALVSADSLYWFADVVASNSDDLENALVLSRGEGDGDQESSDIGDMDFFEYMTLKLIETKVAEFSCSRPMERDDLEEEETGIAHLLLTKPRRGQGRRRRQRRDFQKDILPGLASLARHEVTEDLQIIGGLMKASGQSWQAGAARRKTGRNSSNCQARGRRRTRGIAAPTPEVPVDPLPRPLSTNIVETDGLSIMGWGRTTRRCRRQRGPLSNILAQSLS